MALALTQYSGQLASQLNVRRRSVSPGGQGAGGERGVQRLGPVTSNAGQTYLLYYDPDTDTIFYDTGYPVISQE